MIIFVDLVGQFSDDGNFGFSLDNFSVFLVVGLIIDFVDDSSLLVGNSISDFGFISITIYFGYGFSLDYFYDLVGLLSVLLTIVFIDDFLIIVGKSILVYGFLLDDYSLLEITSINSILGLLNGFSSLVDGNLIDFFFGVVIILSVDGFSFDQLLLVGTVLIVVFS